jgi:hypothetical protein
MKPDQPQYVRRVRRFLNQFVASGGIRRAKYDRTGNIGSAKLRLDRGENTAARRRGETEE